MKKRILLVCALFLIFSFTVFADESRENTYNFEVLSTTDMHGRCATKNISTSKKEDNSILKVASVVRKEKKIFGDKILLIDNGDLIQGTLISQYALTKKTNLENPMITAIKDIGYDVWVMGNHEFNYLPNQRDTQVKYALDAGIDVLGGNIVLENDGFNVKGEKNTKGQPFYSPYFIKTFDFEKGKKIRVAVIGLGNANNENWDSSENYPNLKFSSLDNPNGFLDFEINKIAKEIKEKNLADIIIVSAHSGKSTDTGIKTDNFMLESQAVEGAKKSKNIDLLIYGHDHQPNIEKVLTSDKKEIYVINGGGTSVTKNVFTVKFDKNNNIKICNVSAELLNLKDYKNDNFLSKKLQHWYEETYTLASAPLGFFYGGWNEIEYQIKGKNNTDLVLKQTAINDLIHKAQIWASWKLYKTKQIKGATVSITSSSMAQDKNKTIAYIPKDNDKISLLTLSLLYMYGNNSICVTDMVPLQLYAWMNRVANKLMLDNNGNPAIKPDQSLHGTDTFYGIDYAFDLTKPEGKRVVYAKINGENLLDMKKPIRVVLNNFRIAGGHSFFDTTGLTEEDCLWTSANVFPKDKSNFQSLLGEYVQQKGKISPKDKSEYCYNSKWHIITKP